MSKSAGGVLPSAILIPPAALSALKFRSMPSATMPTAAVAPETDAVVPILTLVSVIPTVCAIADVAIPAPAIASAIPAAVKTRFVAMIDLLPLVVSVVVFSADPMDTRLIFFTWLVVFLCYGFHALADPSQDLRRQPDDAFAGHQHHHHQCSAIDHAGQRQID